MDKYVNMGWVRGGDARQGREKDFTKTRAFIFNLELGTTDHRTIPFCKSRWGRSQSATVLGLSESGAFLWSFWIKTALLSGPFLRQPLPRRHSCQRGGWTWEKFSYWKHELRNFFFWWWCFLSWTPYSWQLWGFWCQHKMDHTPQLPSWHVCLFGFVTSYIMQNYFCTNCSKVIYARFECIPVFLLFWDCQLSWFPSGRRELNLNVIRLHLHTCPDLAKQAKTFQLKACLTGSWEPALYVKKLHKHVVDMCKL